MKRHRLAAAFLLVAALFIGPGPALAKWPNPYMSTVSRPVVICPAGDSLFVLIGRDVNGVPCAGSEITIDFARCPDFHFCPLRGDEAYSVDPTGLSVTTTTDGLGYLAIAFRGGGTALRDTIKILGDGVPVALVGLASLDQNGDLRVDAEDEAIVEARLGTADWSADFDHDGVVTDSDVAIVHAHLGHFADGTSSTPVERGSWGRIKRLYR